MKGLSYPFQKKISSAFFAPARPGVLYAGMVCPRPHRPSGTPHRVLCAGIVCPRPRIPLKTAALPRLFQPGSDLGVVEDWRPIEEVVDVRFAIH